MDPNRKDMRRNRRKSIGLGNAKRRRRKDMATKLWFVYVVQCRDSSYYTGVSTDVQHRVDTHNTGKGAKYTRSRRPVRLMWHKQFPSQSDALKFEASFKRLTRIQKTGFLMDEATAKIFRKTAMAIPIP